MSGVFTYLPPEKESARSGAPSGTCADGGGDAPSAPFQIGSPLTVSGSGDRFKEDRPRTRKWVQSIGFWAGEIIGAASIFIILFVSLFIGGIMQ